MTNECNSVRMAFEALLLFLYAWNSCPVPGTDISRSLVAFGRKFAFSIDFWLGCIKDWCPHPQPSSLTPMIFLSTLPPVAKLQYYWYPNTVPGTMNWSTHADATPECTTLVTLSSLVAPLGLMPLKVVLASSNFPSLVPGGWSVLLMADPTISKTAITLLNAWRSTPLTSHLILQNLSLLNPSMAPNTQYSQLHKAIDPHPLKEAGTSGFLSLQPASKVYPH
jgi:hypothetical protein